MSTDPNSLEPMSEEEFAESSNKMSIMLTQLGVEFDSVRDSLVDRIVEACDGFTSEDEVSAKANEVYGHIFHEQIQCYLKGAEYFVTTFKQYGKKLNLDLKFVDVDTISLESDKSQSYIIDSTTKLMTIVGENMVSPMEDDAETFRHKMNMVISMYLETSFILGLTDAKVLNYYRNKAEGVEIGELIHVLEDVFTKVF